MSARSFHLEDLLWPTAPADFYRDNWEKTPFAVSRGDENHYAGLLSLNDVDQIIAFSRPKFTDPAAFQTAGPSRPTYVRGMLEAPSYSAAENPGICELRQVFDQGKSVVIMAMQHRWPAVAELCRNLEAAFHCPVHANMYLTPAGSQGFAAHFDTHEVLILQLEGIKHWRLYGTEETLPLVSENPGVPNLPLGTPQEVCLKAGDLLYIPRGHVHEAFTSDFTSLHLTVGINVYRWADLLRHALASAARGDARYRESIPGGALPADKSELKEHFKQLLVSLADSTSLDAMFDDAMYSLGDQFLGQLRMLPGGQFASPIEIDRLDLETIVEKSQAICRVVQDQDGVVIEFPGNRVAGPPRIASALRFVAGATRFAVRELPDDLNAESKLVLVRRLLREGLLKMCGPPPSAALPPFLTRPVADQVPSGGEIDESRTPKANDWDALEPAQQMQEPEHSQNQVVGR